jgi:hypothetical protein
MHVVSLAVADGWTCAGCYRPSAPTASTLLPPLPSVRYGLLLLQLELGFGVQLPRASVCYE